MSINHITTYNKLRELGCDKAKAMHRTLELRRSDTRQGLDDFILHLAGEIGSEKESSYADTRLLD
ncbi:hypothetical protein [Listeria booriae]|uniref:hypothetical protein n=1 Tax=Listeria booriae TaxID=1552123 RepID=UPI00162A37D2|nr:hypothetical protein [Listeria booriae]MBC2080858.1 hypothetical protein [Listeria booriae]MBC2324635.1 hypothetical protein [Listeria booriae]